MIKYYKVLGSQEESLSSELVNRKSWGGGYSECCLENGKGCTGTERRVRKCFDRAKCRAWATPKSAQPSGYSGQHKEEAQRSSSVVCRERMQR